MSVKIINGDLLRAKEDIICHQVNCRGFMGSGVASAIKHKWPEVYECYREHCLCNKPGDLLGTVQFTVTNGFINVANLFAQETCGSSGQRYTSYDAFYECLENIRDRIHPSKSLAFPYRIGSDRGGASWDVIYAMICDVLGDREVTIYRLSDN